MMETQADFWRPGLQLEQELQFSGRFTGTKGPLCPRLRANTPCEHAFSHHWDFAAFGIF